MTSNDLIELRMKIRRTRTLKMAYNQSPSDGRKIPAIRFSGEYLEGLGFVVGGHYDLVVQEDSSILLIPKPPKADVVTSIPPQE